MRGHKQALIVVLSMSLIALAWGVDLLADTHTDLDLVYMLPIALASWMLGVRWGAGLGLLCYVFATWRSAESYGEGWALYAYFYWNAAARLVLFMMAVVLAARFRSARAVLECAVRERTAQLHEKVEAMSRLELQLLQTEEAELRRIGQDLHDSLGQDLTGIAFLSQEMQESLAAKGLPESGDAARLAGHATAALRRAGRLARGLCPVEMHGGTLAAALGELAEQAAEVFHVECGVENGELLESILDGNVAAQLYRIAQEAVRNAVRHGRCGRITIRASMRGGRCLLEILDDGVGLPSPLPEGRGIGLSVMRCRAASIQGNLTLATSSAGGALVGCEWPAAPEHGKPT